MHVVQDCRGDFGGVGVIDSGQRSVTDLEICQFVAACDGELLQRGYSVSQTADAGFVKRTCEELQKPYLTKILDPGYSDYTVENSFWIVVFWDDKPVGLVGARKDGIPKGDFVRFFRSKMKRLYSADSEHVIEDKSFPPPFYEMHGNVVYLGDLFIAREHRGADKINLRALLLLVMGVAYQKWRYSWVYAFVTAKHGSRGYFQRYCFSNTYEHSLTWRGGPAERSDDDVFGCSRRIDTEYLMHTVLRKPTILEDARSS